MTSARSVARLVLAAVLAGLLGVLTLGLAAPASAHTQITGTSPDKDEVLETGPDEVVVTLSQAALAVGTEMSVQGPSGEVAEGKARLVDRTVRQTLASGLERGTYKVTYRITSADGHPVSGNFRFAVETSSSPTGEATPTDPPSPTETAVAEPTPSVTSSAPVGGIPAERVSADQGSDDSTVKIGAGVVVLAALAVLVGAVINRRRAPRA